MLIQVRSPSRLHFGLIDLNGEMGRINGSLGIAIDEPSWDISGTLSEKKSIGYHLSKEYSNLITIILNYFDERFGTDSSKIAFNISKIIPEHIGLGSKTQFSLTIGTILTHLHKVPLTYREIASIVKRGGTSGIGVGAFEAGGLILDGGHSFGLNKMVKTFLPSSVSTAPPPPILSRIFPSHDWRFVLICPRNIKGLYGQEELLTFQKNCPIPSIHAEKLSRLILMKILPAAIENNIKLFGEGLTEMQTKFSRFGMEKYENTIVDELLHIIRKENLVYGSGISSFGPTIFALVNSEVDSQAIIKKMLQYYSSEDLLLIESARICHIGARITSKDSLE